MIEILFSLVVVYDISTLLCYLMLNKYMGPINMNLTYTTTRAQCWPESNGNEEVPHII